VDECKPLLTGAVRHGVVPAQVPGPAAARGRPRRRACRGRAWQVDPINPTLTARGIKHLKLKYYQGLSGFAFYFDLRRYPEDDDDDQVLGDKAPDATGVSRPAGF
jgi:hypothetical protein